MRPSEAFDLLEAFTGVLEDDRSESDKGYCASKASTFTEGSSLRRASSAFSSRSRASAAAS